MACLGVNPAVAVNSVSFVCNTGLVHLSSIRSWAARGPHDLMAHADAGDASVDKLAIKTLGPRFGLRSLFLSQLHIIIFTLIWEHVDTRPRA